MLFTRFICFKLKKVCEFWEQVRKAHDFGNFNYRKGSSFKS